MTRSAPVDQRPGSHPRTLATEHQRRNSEKITHVRPDDPALGPTTITVGCVNFEAVPRDKAATLEKMGGFVAEAAARGCDLVIFPELALNTWGECAECADAHEACKWHRAQAEPADGPSCHDIVDLAASHG